ncbi:GDYXXLXY domain-containing protein [Spongiibacter marinus]|uniref:GDYXXLXY domain-containing protein n=1 Tax=Spongiibacter marinus TaxID=354246 RepID=UPI000404B892|nr:GDYXXLXY domain-containing protein [Spongiibacter marinus]
MRASWLGIAILAQFALLVWQTYGWENLLHNGQSVFLRSMPVDPRDPMRGDYLRLNYAANNIPSHLYRGLAPLSSLERGDSVYTAFESVGGVAAVTSVSSEPPSSGLFIKGRLTWSPQGERLGIAYGLGQLYRQQGRALEMELMQGGEEGVPRSLDIELAVDDRGRALIRGYRWAELGMAVTVVNGDTPVLEVRIRNYADDTVYISSDAQHCAFDIVFSDPQPQSLAISTSLCDAPGASSRQAIAAGQETLLRIDLSAERWTVLGNDGAARPLWYQRPLPRLRLIYQERPSAAGGAQVQLWSPPFNLPRLSGSGQE